MIELDLFRYWCGPGRNTSSFSQRHLCIYTRGVKLKHINTPALYLHSYTSGPRALRNAKSHPSSACSTSLRNNPL